MRFLSPLAEGKLLRRYKRFLADVELTNGEVVTCHTANTGGMLGCAERGSRVWLSDSKNEKRKYPLTWELVENKNGVKIGINTQYSNRLVQEAIESGVVTELADYSAIRSEVPYGRERSRIDLLLSGNDVDCYVEVKNVTYGVDEKGYFPDAVTKRGQKHLRELMEVVGQGERAVIFFCVQRGDVKSFSPADQIDPEYGLLLREAVSKGVEALAYVAEISESEIRLTKALPVTLG